MFKWPALRSLPLVEVGGFLLHPSHQRRYHQYRTDLSKHHRLFSYVVLPIAAIITRKIAPTTRWGDITPRM
ncbi:hypothetical protein [Enterovibrio nigricans]|uniref:hypothetical protein n=1 Tax=Enterovibrio nigricans TaxID=504469 RepID=UPI001115B91D|nr:hypothetical protein [Enterovibrio nigricans]